MGGRGGSISGNQSANMSPRIVLDVKLTPEVGRLALCDNPGRTGLEGSPV